MNVTRYYHGTGRAFAPGDELDDTHGSGLWLSTSQQAASHYARLNAMGRREYFGDAEARPHVYEVAPDGPEGVETGFRARRATILREVEYVLPYRAESWEDYAALTPPAVLEMS